jgi:hypothetical protein
MQTLQFRSRRTRRQAFFLDAVSKRNAGFKSPGDAWAVAPLPKVTFGVPDDDEDKPLKKEIGPVAECLLMNVKLAKQMRRRAKERTESR